MNGKSAGFDCIAFICPSCGVHARQIWQHYVFNGNLRRVSTGLNVVFDGPEALASSSSSHSDGLSIALCSNCEEHSVWVNEEMIFPLSSTAPLPTENMPDDVMLDFNEARRVLMTSPRSSAALLRLALQKLCVALGGDGKNINNDIQLLVRNGLPIRIQRALDIVRVIGNDSVHPGQIDINDNPEIAKALFEMINFIVDKMITEHQEIDRLYDILPADKRIGIEIRDLKKS